MCAARSIAERCAGKPGAGPYLFRGEDPGLKIRPFSDLTPRQVAEAVAIYREAFEAPWEWPAERIAGLGAACAAPDARCCAMALLDDDASVALAVAQYLPGGNVWYLCYLAVAASCRGGGLGSRLLTAMLPLGDEFAAAAGKTGCLGTLIEVEQVAAPPPNADRTQRRQRIAFYRRHGALDAGVTVPRPPWAPPEMPDWDILLIPGRGWDGRPDRAGARSLCRSLMVEGYHIAPDAPWLADYLANLAPISQDGY